MSGLSTPARSAPRDRIVFGLVLVLVGVAALVLQVVETTAGAGGWVVLLVGVGLLGGFAYTRQYGYLVPGGIMTGLGAGIIVSESVMTAPDEASGGVIVLGLGLGFVSIWVLSGLLRLVQHHWWPLIPGGILTAVGAALLVGGLAVDLLDYWGIVVAAVGVIVLWRAYGDRHAQG